MFQSALTCREYQKFITIAKESRQKAIEMLVKYTYTDQMVLHDLLEAVESDSLPPNLTWNEMECRIQDDIIKGKYKTK